MMIIYQLFIVLWTCLLLESCFAQNASTTTKPTEYNLLKDLYISTNGWNWTYTLVIASSGIYWNFSGNSDPCVDAWYGVSCIYIEPYYYVAQLDLKQYNLVGPLPDSIGDFEALYNVDLTDNFINGTLPDTISKLAGLYQLYLGNNLLTGTVPESYGKLSALLTFDLGHNLLTGTLSDNLFAPQNFVSVDFSYNNFVGTIPSSLLCNSSIIQYLSLSYNQLSGSLPNCIGNLTTVTSLYLQFNQLSGTLPIELGNCVGLHSLSMSHNFFYGTIPQTISGWTSLRELDMALNLLSGPIPATMIYYPRLTAVILSDNYLSGTLSESFGYMSATLTILDISQNRISGVLPASVGHLSSVSVFLFNNNMLSGTLPKDLGELEALSDIQLKDNKLTGSINNVFNFSNQGVLATIQFDQNQFTGELPNNIFRLPSLRTLTAVSNCFDGTLPIEMCNCSSLQVLVLDGLSSASSCRQRILPGLFHSYVVKHTIDKSIPSCLFHMPRLTTLHLSGNGLTGPIPLYGGPTNSCSTVLQDLVLSHNFLTSTIPTVLQERRWYNLDLSFNRLKGSLSYSFADGYAPNGSLSLEHNRLSGDIPSGVQNIQNISILRSNLFACRNDRSDLPAHDSDQSNYECGSHTFLISYYIWIGIVGLVFITVGLTYYFRVGSISGVYASWWEAIHLVIYGNTNSGGTTITEYPRLGLVLNAMDLIMKSSVYACLFIVIALLPMYLTFSSHHGTFTHQYAWSASIAFKSGVEPFVCEFVLLLLLLIMSVAAGKYMIKVAISHKFRKPTQITTSNSTSTLRSDTRLVQPDTQFVFVWKQWAVLCIFILTNFVVVGAVNSAYVYVALYHSETILFVCQVLVAAFKLFWNRFGGVILARQALHYAALASPENHHSFERFLMSVKLFVLLVNNIAIPYLVVLAINPSCFYNVIVQASSVSTNFIYASCTTYDTGSHECVQYSTSIGETTYSPSFAYNYQCSGSIVTYYAPAYVYMCIAGTFGSTMLQYVLLKLHSIATPGTRWFSILDAVTPRILLPIQRPSSSVSSPSSPSHEPAASPSQTMADVGEPDLFRPYFDAGTNVIMLLIYVALLFTFGAMFPPLAVCLLLAIGSSVVMVKLKMGRFLINVRATESEKYYMSIVEAECKGAGDILVLQRFMWHLLTCSCWFYALFLFDTLGDSVGFNGSYWVLIFMGSLPIVMYAVWRMKDRVVSRSRSNQMQNESSVVLESQDSVLFDLSSGADAKIDLISASVFRNSGSILGIDQSVSASATSTVTV